MIEVFKTNVSSEKKSKIIIDALHLLLPNAKINFDLEDSDKILKIESSSIAAHIVIEYLLLFDTKAKVLE